MPDIRFAPCPYNSDPLAVDKRWAVYNLSRGIAGVSHENTIAIRPAIFRSIRQFADTFGQMGGAYRSRFSTSVEQAHATCLLPFGIIEKHGPQLPLGTDLIKVRYVAEHAAQQEYAVVFPSCYFGQIFEARHEPGTLAYSAKLQMDLLQEPRTR